MLACPSCQAGMRIVEQGIAITDQMMVTPVSKWFKSYFLFA